MYQHEYALTKIACVRGNMAAPKFTSAEIEGIYRLLVVLNSSLRFLINQLYDISSNKALSAKYLRDMEALTEEVRATLNKKAVK